jgi:AcrR family transcriptional regulator
MPPNLQDRRVQRTRQLLKDALLNLIQKKGYSSISIQDLTDQANLGKATFYKHYKDKDELLYESMDSVLKELKEKILLLPNVSWSVYDPRPLRLTYEFVAENAIFIKVMMQDPGGLIFFQLLQKIVTDLVIQSMKMDLQNMHTQPLVPLEFLSNHYAGSMLATIEWWVSNDMSYSIDEMVNMFLKTDMLTRSELMGGA